MTVLPCPGCGAATATALLAYGATLQPAVVSLARNALPAWQPQDGLCPRCALGFTQQLAARRSPLSLHTTTEPTTTFPFYDWDEETVLSQPARLPGYETITAAGVTIAFLDSGYYPHPDFSTATQWPGPMPAWQQLDQRSLRALFAQANPRLIQYADLTDEGEQVGLESPSLWDDAGDSWHGQMTMAVAAGNGLLSGGVYRGYATGASLLPVKVGRSGGRIPEADILRGLTWLLADDNWQRYGVRVVNISVGGDFPQDWQHNPVCRAAHALAQRGVFVAAAAGNRGAEELLAPAQTPTVMTVGGVDDQNRRWRPTHAAEVEALTLYNHNFGAVSWRHALVRKPEILALARWLPSPILPPSRVFKETYAIEQVRRALHAIEAELEEPSANRPSPLAPLLPEVWQGLRQRMNAHKWLQPYYQHVDGTSVAVAQVSAVAAQMLAANPALTGEDVRHLLMESALALPHLLPRQTGAGLLQPTLAVAAALRAPGGPLVGYPRSGVALRASELHKWVDQGKLALVKSAHKADERAQSERAQSERAQSERAQSERAQSEREQSVYFGLYAPQATRVSLLGSFNDWQPGQLLLQPAANGWWQGTLQLPTGEHVYRFWIENVSQPQGFWLPDPENPVRAESGYADAHSVVEL